MLVQSVMGMTMFDNTYGQRFVWQEELGTHIKHYKVLIPTSMSNLLFTWVTSLQTLGLDEKVSASEKQHTVTLAVYHLTEQKGIWFQDHLLTANQGVIPSLYELSERLDKMSGIMILRNHEIYILSIWYISFRSLYLPRAGSEAQ